MPNRLRSSDSAKRALMAALNGARWAVVGALAVYVGYQYMVPPVSYQDTYVVPLRETAAAPVSLDSVRQAAPDPTYYQQQTALKLVELGHLLLDQPKYRPHIAKQLNAISTVPDLFEDDMTAYLTLRTAYWQLRHDSDTESPAEAALLVWHAAEQIDRVSRYPSRQIAADQQP